jgi:hypothetical protein
VLILNNLSDHINSIVKYFESTISLSANSTNEIVECIETHVDALIMNCFNNKIKDFIFKHSEVIPGSEEQLTLIDKTKLLQNTIYL